MSKYNGKIVCSVVLAMAAYLIALSFGFLGFALIGAGHGSGIFGYLFYSPVVGGNGSYFHLGLIIWPAVGLLLPWARSFVISAIILALLFVSYYGITHDMIANIHDSGTTFYAVKVIKDVPDLVVIICLMFVLMQASIIGGVIFLRIKGS